MRRVAGLGVCLLLTRRLIRGGSGHPPPVGHRWRGVAWGIARSRMGHRRQSRFCFASTTGGAPEITRRTTATCRGWVGWGPCPHPDQPGPAAVVRSKQTGTSFKGGVSATSGVVTRVRAKAASSTEAGCGRERERDTFSPPGPSQRAAKLRPDLLRVAISYLLPAHPGTTGRRLRFPPLLSPPGGHTDGRTLRRGFRPSGERMRAPGDAVAGPPPARPCPAGALAVRLAMCSR